VLDLQLVGTQQMTSPSGVDKRHPPLAGVVQQCGTEPRAEDELAVVKVTDAKYLR
jgi:hypothetical protein